MTSFLSQLFYYVLRLKCFKYITLNFPLFPFQTLIHHPLRLKVQASAAMKVTCYATFTLPFLELPESRGLYWIVQHQLTNDPILSDCFMCISVVSARTQQTFDLLLSYFMVLLSLKHFNGGLDWILRRHISNGFS